LARLISERLVFVNQAEAAPASPVALAATAVLETGSRLKSHWNQEVLVCSQMRAGRVPWQEWQAVGFEAPGRNPRFVEMAHFWREYREYNECAGVFRVSLEKSGTRAKVRNI
jgi:hypothetical protein